MKFSKSILVTETYVVTQIYSSNKQIPNSRRGSEPFVKREGLFIISTFTVSGPVQVNYFFISSIKMG